MREGAMEKAKNALQRGKDMAMQAGEAMTDVIETGLNKATRMGKKMSRRASGKRAAGKSKRTTMRGRPTARTTRRTSKARKTTSRRPRA